MTENPFKTDEKLKSLLQDANNCQTGESFLNWKASFLKVYQTYLDPDGVLNAKDASDRLVIKLETLAKTSLRVEALTKDGNIGLVQITADGRRALSRWTEDIKEAEKAVDEYCPKSTADMDKVGYDKYELGAVLIRDGFNAYEIMLVNREFIQNMRSGPLDGLLDPNSISIMDFYDRQIQSFVDVMSDLGLFKLMKKCVELYQEEPRPDPKLEPEIFTELPEEEEVQVSSDHGRGKDKAGKLHTSGKGSARKQAPGGADAFGKAARKPKKGSDHDKSKDAEEEDEEEPPPPSEGDDANAQIIYFDPKTGAIGTLPREACMQSELMFGKNDKGEPLNQGAIEDKAERENLVWLLKKLEKREKPKEGAWLEEIKKEKALRQQMEAERLGRERKPSVRVTRDSSTRSKSPGRKSRKSIDGSGHKPSQLGRNSGHLSSDSGHRTTASGRRMANVEDLQGKYKDRAAKPAGGWEKVKGEYHEHGYEYEH